MNMFALLRCIAHFIFPIKEMIFYCCILLSVTFVGLFIFADHAQQAQFLMPNLLAFLWALMLLVLCHSFYQPNAQLQNKLNTKSWLSRFKSTLKHTLLWLYSLVFIALIVASIYFTYKITSI